MPGLGQVTLAQQLPASGWVDRESAVDDGSAEERTAEPLATASMTMVDATPGVASAPLPHVSEKVRDASNPVSSTAGRTQSLSPSSKTTPVVIMPKALRPGRRATAESVALPDVPDSLAEPAVGAQLRPALEQGGIARVESSFDGGPEARPHADAGAPSLDAAERGAAPVPTSSAERSGSPLQATALLPREPALRIASQSIEGRVVRADPDASEALATAQQGEGGRLARDATWSPLHDDRTPLVIETPHAPDTDAARDVLPAAPRTVGWFPTVPHSAPTELARISIGRVDVQVNNMLPAPLVSERPRETPSRRGELEARYLDRFWLRP
jgi:hypothetical protein